MKRLRFWKMHGSGNDFIVFDNRAGRISERAFPDLARRLCSRKTAVGADGLIAIHAPSTREADFLWRFFNADGSEGEMCGNGGRCVALFALAHDIAGPRMRFETLAGIIEAAVDDGRVTIGMPSPVDLSLHRRLDVNGEAVELHCVNTGVPHAAIFVESAEALESCDVEGVGRAVRRHEAFAPAGTNVDFIQVESGSSLALRTYERGVEDETLACGTGAVAAAVIAAALGRTKTPVEVRTRGGEVLIVHTDREADRFIKVSLEGEARAVYEGELLPEMTKTPAGRPGNGGDHV